MAGRAHGTESSGVRALSKSARPRGWSGMSGWQAQSESAHEEWGPEGIGVSTGSSWPRPTAGTMDRIAAVTVDGTPFESN
jgi:hypothetical protein